MNELEDDEQDLDIHIEAVFSKRRKAFCGSEEEAGEEEITASQTGTSLNMVLSQLEASQRELQKGISDLLESKESRSKFSKYKLYELWTGNNVFCLEGKLLNGLKQKSFQSRITLFLIISSFLIFMIFPAYYLYDKISPFMVMITIYMFLMTMFFYCMTYT